MLSAPQAAEAIRSAFAQVHGRAPSPRELLILLAHSQIESGWGAGSYRLWPLDRPDPPPKGSPSRNDTNNWGAVQWTGANGVENRDFFYGLDTHANGKPYRAKIRLYPTPADGALSFVQNATKVRGRDRTVLPFLDAGDPYDYAQRARTSGYFELSAEAAGKAFWQAASGIAPKLGLPPPVRGGAGQLSSPSLSAFVAVGALAVAGAAVYLYTKKG